MAIDKTWEQKDGEQTLALVEMSKEMGGVSLHIYDGIWYNQSQMQALIDTLQATQNEMIAKGVGG